MYAVFVPDHLRSKFDKKAIRCIFVGYSSERKGWKCCDPTTGQCYTSRNVVFDEASSWWSPQKEELPNIGDLENRLQKELGEIREGEESQDSTKEPMPNMGDNEQEHSTSDTLEKSMSPWQTGVPLRSPEELRPSQQEVEEDNPPLRRSTRQRKPNQKYVNAALAEEESVKEPATFDEASRGKEWQKGNGGRNKSTNRESDLGTSFETQRCEANIMQMGV